MRTSFWNGGVDMPFLDACCISFSYSRRSIGFFDCFPANIVDLWFIFFGALWLSLRIHTPTWYCGRIREPTRTCIVLHFSSLLLQVEAVWWPTLCSEAQQRVDAASSKHACEHTRTKHTGLHSHTLFFFSSLSHTCKHARLRRAVIDSGSVEPR